MLRVYHGTKMEFDKGDINKAKNIEALEKASMQQKNSMTHWEFLSRTQGTFMSIL